MLSLFKKTKKVSPAEVHLVADLDKIIGDPVGFRFGGKVHVIKPVSTKEFWKLSNALVELWALKDQPDVTPEELVTRYHALIASVCDSVTRSDIEGMTQAQVAGLFTLVMDAASGKAHAREEGEKKKERLTGS